MPSIIIPAHNEAAVIARTLRALLAQATDEEEIIVVANGCSDETAAQARAFSPRVQVIETPTGSKSLALNLGDRAATRFPRWYVDADIELTPGSLKAMNEALASGPLLAASPTPRMELSGCSWAVRAYYSIWLGLPYCREGMIGAGVYGLSQTGRARFAEFPDIIADDGYVRALFRGNERGNVKGATAIVRAPATLAWLLKIKTRSRLGRMQLAARYPGLIGNEQKSYGDGLTQTLRHPSKWAALIVYAYVVLTSRWLAKRRYRDLAQYRWEKDASSRVEEKSPA